MKNKFVKSGILLMFGLSISLASWAQVNSPTMYNGTGNTAGTSGSYYGTNCSITGSRSFGGGTGTTVSGSNSVGFGYNTNVSGIYSFGFGYMTDVTSHYSVGMGFNADASGLRSLSLGYSTLASGNSSVAIGYLTNSVGQNAISLGTYLESTAQGSMTIGYGVNSNYRLTNNISKSLMIGFNSDLPTFCVGPANGTGTVGNIGIGTTPSSIKRLTVAKLNGADWEYGLSVVTDNDLTRAIAVNDASGTDLFVVWGNGSANIKKLYTEEVEVRPGAIGMYWPDYVFEDDYHLSPLSEVSDYIKLNSHLPNVPSTQEVLEEGIDLAEMDAILLRKIEELTLYILEQQEQIEELKKLTGRN